MKKTVPTHGAKKPLPIAVVISIDILVFAVSMTVFCYFHHIRMLWGLGASDSMVEVEKAPEPVQEDNQKENVSQDNSENPPKEDSLEDMELPNSRPGLENVPRPAIHIEKDGDFSFPGIFAADGETVLLTDNEEIRQYLLDKQLPISTTDGTNYVGLYHTDGIYLTAERVQTQLVTGSRSSRVVYYIYDVYLKNLENLYSVALRKRQSIGALADGSYQIASPSGDSVLTSPAILAVNGDYWLNSNQTVLAVRNGKILRDSHDIAEDVCVLYNDGVMETLTAEQFDYDKVFEKEVYQLWEFGPSLLDENGAARREYVDTYYDDNVIGNRNPRSSIGYYEPGHYCFLVVDGRSSQSSGVRMVQLAELFEGLGCKAAYNLDGGDSAQSWFNGSAHRVDERRVQKGEAQRNLCDIICIGEVTPETED